jgi:hypothetical protein
MKGSGYGTTIKIKDGNVGGAGVGNVCAVAIRRNVDEVGPSINPNGSDDFVLLSVNHADVRGAGVNHINFIALGIGRDSGRIRSHLQSPHRTKAAQVNDRDRVALAVRNVGILAVKRAIAGESALVEVIPT